MAIMEIHRYFSDDPNLVGIICDDDLATITAADYFSNQQANINAIQNGDFVFLPSDTAIIYYSPGQIGFFSYDFNTNTFVPLSAGGGGGTENFITDAGTATEVAGNIHILGETDQITTSGTGSTVTIGFVTNPIVTGTLTANNFSLPATASDYSAGTILVDGTVVAAFPSTSTFIGLNVGTPAANINNTAVGNDIMPVATVSALGNVAMGRVILSSLTTGTDNIVICGEDGANSLTTGSANILIGGPDVAVSLVNGSNNIILGSQNHCGSSYTSNESGNILLSNDGVIGDQGVIRIGTNAEQVSVYIAGISGVSVANTEMVTINTTTGQLGSAAISSGSVSSFSAGTLSPLFTSSVANPTTTPALSFVLTNAAANTYFGNATTSSGAPSYTAAGALTKVDDTNVTLSLSANSSTSLLRDVALTLGWTGQLGPTRGGTGASNSGTLTFSGSASVTGSNTGDQNLFSNIPVSGQTTVTASSATTALTFVAGSNITITTDNTAKSITFASSSAGTVNSGTANQLAYYATTGTAVSGLTTGNNGVLITSAGGVPSISSTLPNATQDNITRLGTITSIGAPLGAAFGGTGLSSITAHNFIIGNGTGTPALLAPSATVGVPVVSQGAGADPVYGTALVAGGGTGRASATAYAVICGGTTSTGTQQSVTALGSSGDVLTSNGAGALPTFQTPVGTTGQTIYTQYTASNTWTKNANTKYMMVYMWGAGSGGGSGRFGTINASTGGLGGNCGSVVVLSGPSAFFNATETVTIGAGGTGAAGQTSAGTDGIAGGTGGATLFGSITTGTAQGGRAGSSTTVSAGNNGRLYGAYGVANAGNINGNATVSVGNGGGTVGGNGNLFLLPGGGGAGGPAQSVGTSTGGVGSVLINYDGATLVNGAPGGLLATPTGTNGTSAPVITNGEGVITGGLGAGGGWGEDNGSGVVGAGGNGGTPGGGGGGGGGSSTVTSGAGGNGGRGEVWVIEFTG